MSAVTVLTRKVGTFLLTLIFKGPNVHALTRALHQVKIICSTCHFTLVTAKQVQVLILDPKEEAFDRTGST